MPIRYTLKITDWTIPDEVPIWDDEYGDGNYPRYLDDEGRQYNAFLKIEDETITDDDGEEHTIYKSTGCCGDMTGVFGAMNEGFVSIEGNYQNNDLYLSMGDGHHSKEMNICPFCGEDIELVCDQVIIQRPTFGQRWSREGEEVVGVEDAS